MEKKNRKQRRETSNGRSSENTSLSIKSFAPMTNTQEDAFNSWDDGFNLMLHGIAGTGKTFLGLLFALTEVMKPNSKFKKVYVIRSVVPTRDMGFMPGNQKEKTKVYEGPYYEICTKLFGRGDAYDYLKNIGKIEFVSTSFLRGITLDDCIVVVDECQSMTFHELDTVVTRLGENARLVFCGDINQNDLKYKKNDVSGLWDFMSILKKMKHFSFIEFMEEDIVRSAVVKSYIIQKNKMGL